MCMQSLARVLVCETGPRVKCSGRQPGLQGLACVCVRVCAGFSVCVCAGFSMCACVCAGFSVCVCRV